MPIRKNIQLNYQRKLIQSLFCLAVLLLFWVFSPCREFFYPVQIPADNLGSRLNSNSRYASFEEVNLHYTGYCHTQRGNIKGYYYYGFLGDDCLFFLLKNSTCNDGQESLTLKNLHGAVSADSPAEKVLITNLAEDLEWDSIQLEKITKPFFIVEGEYHWLLAAFTYGLIFFLTALTFLTACLSVLYILRPALSPFCGSLLKPAKSMRWLLHAEKELEEHCLVQGKNFFITSHFLIDLSKNTTHILPLKQLAWVFEHSAPSSFLSHRRKVRYTITYYNKRKHAVHSVYENYADVDTILSYLRDYYPEILNGYTPENQALFKKL